MDFGLGVCVGSSASGGALTPSRLSELPLRGIPSLWCVFLFDKVLFSKKKG